MFTHFIENKLISKNESKSKPSNPCINQLLMKHFPALMIVTKLREYSLTFERISIKCVMRELFIKLDPTGSREI